MKKQNVIAVSLLLSTLGAQAQIITTIAGNDTAGYSGDGSVATSAKLHSPAGITIDGAGDLFIADFANDVVRKVNTSGTITTVAGNGIAGFFGDGGAATSAELDGFYSVAVDASGNLYIADNNNSRVRKVNIVGTISTVVGSGTSGYAGDGGAATIAQLSNPSGIAIDGSGNMYISEMDNVIRKINSLGTIGTVAGNYSLGGGYSGDGSAATSATILNPIGIAIDGAGNMYFADASNFVIRKVNSLGIIATVAGNHTSGYSGDGGAATNAQFGSLDGIAIDGSGNIFVADYSNNVVRKVNSLGIISTVAGNHTPGYSGDGGAATAAELNGPFGVAVDGSGNLYISDRGNNVIRKVSSGSTTAVNSISTGASALKVYPNPNSGVFAIEGSLNSIVDEKMSLEVVNMLGQGVYSNSIIMQNGRINAQIMLPCVGNGVYLLKIKTGTETLSRRFTVEK